MVALSAKEKWLVDAGVPFVAVDQQREWEVRAPPLESQLLTTQVVQIPPNLAAIALSALSALADHIKQRLNNPTISDQDEDLLFNDLEATELAVKFYARELGHIPKT
jgi:hypothetical protein